MTSSDVPAAGVRRAPLVPLPVRCLLTVVALFAAVLPAGFAGAGAGALLGGAAPPWVSQAVAGAVAVAIAVGLAVALTRLVDRRSPGRLRLRLDRRTPLHLLAGTAAAAVAGTAAALVAWPVGAVAPTPAGAGPTLALLPTALVLAFLVQGVPEEVLFRGYLVRTSADRLPVWGVVVLSSVLFGSLHILSRSDADTLIERLLFVLMAVGLGALATAVRLAWGSVWAAVGVHGGFHLTWFVLGAWVVTEPEAYGSQLLLLAGTQLLAAAAILLEAVRSGRLAWRAPLPRESDDRGRVGCH